jgi:hypothetical protein
MSAKNIPIPSIKEQIAAAKGPKALPKRMRPKIDECPVRPAAPLGPENSITLEIPMPPYRTHPNARCGWRAKATATKRQREEAFVAGLDALSKRGWLGRRPKWEAATIQATFYRPGPQARPSDPGNLTAWLKATEDSLTARVAGNVQGCGILLDDNKLDRLPPIELLGSSAGTVAKVVIVITRA